MSDIEAMGSKLHNAQHRVEILSHHTEEFLNQPELLSTVLEELAVVLEEVEEQYEEVLITRQTLESQRQRYQELFDFAPDGYLVTDASGVIQEVNQAATRLFGLRQEFLLNKPLVLLVANADQRSFRTYFSRLQTAPQQRNWDLQFKSRQGNQFPAVLTASAIRSAQGTLTGWRWLVRDITELKQAVATENVSATQATLDELRANFIQVVSHELRTPMTAIVMSLALLKQHNQASSDGAMKQTYLDRIQEAVWRMNALITDVLLYAESDRLSFKPEPINLESLCEAHAREQQTRDHDRHPITLNSHGACNAVYGDDTLIQQMLDPLLSNAVTYSPVGTPVQITLQCERDRTCISVHNDGTYIPPELQAKLFEPFYRPESTAHIPGVGLGLALVQQAVDRHGGELTVESSIEAGTTFSVTLPGLKG